MSRKLSLGWVVVVMLALSGCQGGLLLLRETVATDSSSTDVLQPTRTSLARQTAEASRTPPSLGTESISTASAEPAATEIPTRVVPSGETIVLPPGFGISVFAEGLAGPRMMALGPDGEVAVAERGAGRVIRLPDRDGDGVADGVEVLAEGLDEPSSIAFFRDGSLYVGETARIVRFWAPDDGGVFTERDVIVAELPQGGHSTRTVLFSPDWTDLFVSIGSSCNVCIEGDPRRAAIVRYTPSGSGEEVFARGLRNAVGITFRPGTNELWATNNGRDYLGDDMPPETIYLVQEGDDAGWPRCHAGRIVDPEFGSPGVCEGVAVPMVEIQAHSAPLGLTFYDGRQFPPEYQGNLFVAFHGSWNRTVPTGYKVVRIAIEDDKPGAVQDFATGWLRADGSAWGRPVDVLTGSDGSLFVSDDDGGLIYRIFYSGDA